MCLLREKRKGGGGVGEEGEREVNLKGRFSKGMEGRVVIYRSVSIILVTDSDQNNTSKRNNKVICQTKIHYGFLHA